MYLPTMEDLKIVVDAGTSSLLSRIGQFLADEGVPAYVVGGFVRDLLLKQRTADIDIAVAPDAMGITRSGSRKNQQILIVATKPINAAIAMPKRARIAVIKAPAKISG